jgi:hypothetical protein
MRGFLGWQDAGTERRREKRQSKGNSAAAKTIHSEMPAIRRSYREEWLHANSRHDRRNAA